MEENWREKLEKASLSRIMEVAYENQVLIPAFNVAYLPMVEAIMEALRETETFALLEVSRPDITRFGAKSFQAVKRNMALWRPCLADSIRTMSR